VLTPLSIFRDANTGAGQDITGLAAAVQLRLRVAVGLQALQRCSGLLNRRARGSTVATHQPSPAAQRRVRLPAECEGGLYRLTLCGYGWQAISEEERGLKNP